MAGTVAQSAGVVDARLVLRPGRCLVSTEFHCLVGIPLSWAKSEQASLRMIRPRQIRVIYEEESPWSDVHPLLNIW